MWESENQDESPLMTTDNFHGIDRLVAATGPQRGVRKHGFTFSDLMQRLLPTIVLDAYPVRAVDGGRAIEIAREMVPTPPFRDGGGNSGS
jgi:hypothetical protein